MTLQQLRLEHSQQHLYAQCDCRLWYVPTPIAVGWSTYQRERGKRRRRLEKSGGNGVANPRLPALSFLNFKGGVKTQGAKDSGSLS